MKKSSILGLALVLAVSLLGSASVLAQTQGQGPGAAAAKGTPAQAATAPSSGVQADGRAQASNDYQIGPEDLLDVSVWNSPALSRTAPVRPDGKISLPLLDDIQAAGLTPMQLRDVIAKKLVDYMPNPEVSVIVREVNRFKVSVLGEGRKPGRFDFKSRATVLDAIALAGGLNDFASRSRILIIRQEGTGTKRIPVNYNKIISASASTSPEDAFFLQPGDVVVVP